METKKCGDCIHADVCEQNPLHTEFSRDNPAYCEGFKDKSKLVEVVRCKDCKHYMLWEDSEDKKTCAKSIGLMVSDPDDFCSYGKKREV